MRRSKPTAGRNDACPCGSGEKLKNCCRKVLTFLYDHPAFPKVSWHTGAVNEEHARRAFVNRFREEQAHHGLLSTAKFEDGVVYLDLDQAGLEDEHLCQCAPIDSEWNRKTRKCDHCRKFFRAVAACLYCRGPVGELGEGMLHARACVRCSERACKCELRDRAWDPNTLKCRTCGGPFHDPR